MASIAQDTFWSISEMLPKPERVHCKPSEKFELTANSLGAHMKVTETSPSMGHGEQILRTFI